MGAAFAPPAFPVNPKFPNPCKGGNIKMASLSELLMNYVRCGGATGAGIVTRETLAGGPPSTDLTCMLPDARSAVVFAVPLNPSYIEPFLTKKDRRSHEKDNVAVNLMASGIALELSNYLKQRGHAAAPVAANQVYRGDTPHGPFDMMPDISLRYLAVRSGIGYFGLSGNVITKKEGAAVIFGAVVTAMDLEPTEPLPVSENYCDGCRLCISSCMSGLMDPDKLTSVSLGGEIFSYSKRRFYMRCEYVCGGFTGLHPSGKWSTWSPGRFPIPEKDRDFLDALKTASQSYNRWPDIKGGVYHVLMDGKLYFTCGNCQLICHPDKAERKRRYQCLEKSGVVIQHPDGTLEAVSPEQARNHILDMAPEARALYETDNGACSS
jgi:epoxyqueuosine reductase